MCADRLEKLIRQADADAGKAPPMPPDLAARVWQRSRRRQWPMRMLSAAAGLLLILGGTWLLHAPRWFETGTSEVVAEAGEDSSAWQERVRELRREAEWRRGVALALIEARAAGDQPAPEKPAKAEIDPQRRVYAALERAAEVLVTQGDQLQQKAQQPAEAARTYRLALTLYPGSTWAAVAQARLKTLIR